MNNNEVELKIQSCVDELNIIKELIDKNKFQSSVQYLSKYALIKACGTIEQAYKSLIYDYTTTCENGKVINYIFKKVKESSMNPNYNNMVSLLKSFDEEWSNKFKKQIKEKENVEMIKYSLESLNNSRNQFAHGGNPIISIDDVIKYFKDSIEIIEIYDNIISDE